MVNRNLVKRKCFLISVTELRRLPCFLLLSRFVFIINDLECFLNRKKIHDYELPLSKEGRRERRERGRERKREGR